MVAKKQNDKLKSKKNILISGILATIVYAISLVLFKNHFVETRFDILIEPEYLALLTQIFIRLPNWLYLVINCILPVLLVLTRVFWRKKYRRILLGLLMLLVVLYTCLYLLALCLPLMLTA